MKVLTVFVSIVVALLLGEVLVRTLTIYPNTLASNRVPDENIGFRASQKIPEVDSQGFRNSEGVPKEIVAIGDSQTFGFNVRSAASWPALLSRVIGKPIYNFGSGGYGLITYHGLLKLFLKPETRLAIVTLYPANDFEEFYASDADCLVLNRPSTFWKTERERLKLEWPAYPVGCLHDDDNSETGFFGNLTRHIAMLVMARDALGLGSAGLGMPGGPEKGVIAIPDGLGTINVARIEMHERSTDPGVPEVAAMMKDLQTFLADWKKMSENGPKIGIVVLPSRERVIHDYFERKGRLGELDPRLANGLKKQIAMEQFVREALEKSGLPFVFANEDLYHHLEFGLQKRIPLYPETDNGHPLELGYAAYASAARRLLIKMGILTGAAN
jgi:lysophospholipase L1-like esterase